MAPFSRLSRYGWLFHPEVEIYRESRNGVTYTISEKGRMRFLKANGIVYSQLSRSSLYVHTYHDKFMPLPLLYSSAKVLVIGLCGGTIPYQMSRMYAGRVSIEAVDIDDGAEALARKFLPEGRIDFNIIVAPGDKFVEMHKNYYDIIIQDAYIGSSVPQEFLDHRFISAACTALRPDGVLAINFIPGGELTTEMYVLNLRKYFDHVYVISHKHMGNQVLICSKRLDKAQMLSMMGSLRSNVNKNELLRAYETM